MFTETHNSTTVTQVKLRDVKLYLCQAKPLLQRHRRQIVDSTKANRLTRLIDGVDHLCSVVDGINCAGREVRQ